MTGHDVQKEVDALDLGRKIRDLRQQRQLTLQNVSDRCGLSKALLSQIENNQAAPPIATLLKISRALNVSIGYFFQDTDHDARIVVVRRKDSAGNVQRAHHLTSEVGYHYRALAYPMVDKRMEPFMVTVEPLAEENKRFFHHRGEEFLFVIEGRIEFSAEEKQYLLNEGDSLYFDSTIPHALRALGNENARALVVVFSQ